MLTVTVLQTVTDRYSNALRECYSVTPPFKGVTRNAYVLGINAGKSITTGLKKRYTSKAVLHPVVTLCNALKSLPRPSLQGDQMLFTLAPGGHASNSIIKVQMLKIAYYNNSYSLLSRRS